MSNQPDYAVSTAEQAGDTVNDIPLQSSELLRKLVSFKIINAIAGKRSDLEGVKQTAFHAGCMVATGVVIRLSLALYRNFPNTFTTLLVVLALLLHGYVLSFLFMPLHEFVHMTAFKSPFLNRIGAFLTGLASLRPPFHYKLYHFAHHRHTGNKEKDPELSDTLLDPDIKTMSGYLFYLSSIPFWISRPMTVLRHAIYGPAIIDPKAEFYIATEEQKENIVAEARVFLVIYALLALGSLVAWSNALLFYWVIPTIIGQPFLRFYLLAEHTGCQLGTNMIANTRTTKTYPQQNIPEEKEMEFATIFGNLSTKVQFDYSRYDFYRRLAWNMPYHAEHHAWPSVPFHHLPTAHKLIHGASLNDSGCNPSGANGYYGVHQGVVKDFLSSKTQ